MINYDIRGHIILHQFNPIQTKEPVWNSSCRCQNPAVPTSNGPCWTLSKSGHRFQVVVFANLGYDMLWSIVNTIWVNQCLASSIFAVNPSGIDFTLPSDGTSSAWLAISEYIGMAAWLKGEMNEHCYKIKKFLLESRHTPILKFLFHRAKIPQRCHGAQAMCQVRRCQILRLQTGS